MKKRKPTTRKGGKADFPDIKKIEKEIEEKNDKNIVEVPEQPKSKEPFTKPPDEIPEIKKDEEDETG